jgi:hypothetical protein
MPLLIGVRVLIERRVDDVIARRWDGSARDFYGDKFRKRGRSRSVTLAAFPKEWFGVEDVESQSSETSEIPGKRHVKSSQMDGLSEFSAEP